MGRKLAFDWIERKDGTSEYEDFLRSLPPKDSAKLVSVVVSVETHGIQTAIQQKWVKKLRDGICEIRSKQGSDIQRVLYFHEVDNEYIITHGFTKKTQQTPDSEINKAKRMMSDYLNGEQS
jgi:phage-related protein